MDYYMLNNVFNIKLDTCLRNRDISDSLRVLFCDQVFCRFEFFHTNILYVSATKPEFISDKS